MGRVSRLHTCRVGSPASGHTSKLLVVEGHAWGAEAAIKRRWSTRGWVSGAALRGNGASLICVNPHSARRRMLQVVEGVLRDQGTTIKRGQ
jgi:hypothetical protein